MVRIGAEAEKTVIADPFAARCAGAGRSMPGFVMVDPHGVTSDMAVQNWLDRALAYVAALPPKPAKNLRSRSVQEIPNARR